MDPKPNAPRLFESVARDEENDVTYRVVSRRELTADEIWTAIRDWLSHRPELSLMRGRTWVIEVRD